MPKTIAATQRNGEVGPLRIAVARILRHKGITWALLLVLGGLCGVFWGGFFYWQRYSIAAELFGTRAFLHVPLGPDPEKVAVVALTATIIILLSGTMTFIGLTLSAILLGRHLSAAPQATAPTDSNWPATTSSPFCTNCGERLGPGNAFCAKCGRPAVAGGSSGTEVQRRPHIQPGERTITCPKCGVVSPASRFYCESCYTQFAQVGD